MLITKDYLRKNPNHIFVFGDNTVRKGLGGAASLRNEPNTFGFITKKYPDDRDGSFFKPDEYSPIFNRELQKLEMAIRNSPNCLWLISPLGSGLANKYRIWEEIIHRELNKLPNRHQNVRLLF